MDNGGTSSNNAGESSGGTDASGGNSSMAGTKASGGSAGKNMGGSTTTMGGESTGGEAMTGGEATGGEPAGGTSTGGTSMAGTAGTSMAGTGGGKMITLDGAAAKGPFINGSSVAVTPVDGSGNPSGNTFPTQTQDEVGNFSVQFAYQGAVQLDAQGQWYNEVTGQTEQSPLTLHGLATVSAAGTQHAYINVVTHLTYLRVKKLMAGGASLSDAVQQAETELRTQLHVGATNFDPNATGTGLNLLGGDTDQAAYVFAISSVSLLGAQAASNITEQQFLNNVQSTFQTAGQVGATYVTAFNKAMPFIEPDYVMRQLAAYFKQVGYDGIVPNINRALDTDTDGIGNLDDTCLLQPNANQDPVRGLCTYEEMDLPQSQGGFAFGSSFTLSGDTDNDTDQDLIKISLPTTEVFTNDGTGKFVRTTIDMAGALNVPSNNPPIQILSAALGKIDSDNFPDLVLSIMPTGAIQNAYSYIYMLPGNGDGTFGARVTVWSSEPKNCVPAGQTCTQGVSVCCGGECMPSGPMMTYQCMNMGIGNVPSVTQLHLVDVNGDNKLDIVGGRGGNAGGNNSSILFDTFLNPGAGAWTDPKEVVVTGASNQSVSVFGLGIGNFTNDSNPDVVALVSAPYGGQSAPTGLYLAKGDGAGNFTLSGPTNTAGGCDTAMQLGDFDEDNKLDLAFLDQNATKLTLAFGVGDGTFTGAVGADVNTVPQLTGVNSGGGGGLCPNQNSQQKGGMGQFTMLSAAAYTGGTHRDVAVGPSIFVTNGRNKPTQQFVYFEGIQQAGKPQAGFGVIAPADADFNGDGATDIVQDMPPAVVLINPPGYHSF